MNKKCLISCSPPELISDPASRDFKAASKENRKNRLGRKASSGTALVPQRARSE
jgi:hypothetical protein